MFYLIQFVTDIYSSMLFPPDWNPCRLQIHSIRLHFEEGFQHQSTNGISSYDLQLSEQSGVVLMC